MEVLINLAQSVSFLTAHFFASFFPVVAKKCAVNMVVTIALEVHSFG